MTKKGLFIIGFLTCSLALITAFGNNSKVSPDLIPYLDPKKLEELVKKIKNSLVTDIVVVDVRPITSYKKGHIPTAINLPNGIINKNYEYLKDKKLILYCETGGRVEFAKKNLIKEGFNPANLLNFGGFYRYKGEIEKLE